MSIDRFTDLSLDPAILRALEAQDYQTPTPIQAKAIPLVLEGGDLLASAPTGTGKTAAFCLPILHRLHTVTPQKRKRVRALILTPTRELALQIEENIRAYSRNIKQRAVVILGGVPSKNQIRNLKNNPDIIVATPGRLLDLMNQKHVHLSRVEMLVLDEADRMLDMGFIHDVRRIVSKVPKDRQTLLFSATLSPQIELLAGDMLKKPATVSVAPPASVPITIDQHVMFVDQPDKRQLLTDILKTDTVQRALVFARTKRRVDRLSRQLSRAGISAAVIHSDKTQNARQKALSAFDKGKIKVLVGTDIVARGIDVNDISHVINYELPEDPENYVHRIGRTARAGTSGIAMSLCNAEEVKLLRNIEKQTLCSITMVDNHPFHSPRIAAIHDRLSATAKPAPPWGRKRKAPRSPKRGRK